MTEVTIERMQPGAWERLRTIRLRSLAESPDAFGTTHAQDLARPIIDWHKRLEVPLELAATFMARAGDLDVGVVTGRRSDDDVSTAMLLGMWVAPEARRFGVGGVLVDTVIRWARGQGFQRIVLDVADNNSPAIALYQSRGFVPNGITGTLPAPRDHVLEHQRTLVLER
jgi:GNAT superfamily N-acetyltransferase